MKSLMETKELVKRSAKSNIFRLTRWIQRILSGFHIKTIRDNSKTVTPNDILLFLIVRDEILRLPYLLKYYFSQ